MFAGATSLACANGLFYWTDGDEVLAEEYHAGQNSYYHNAFPEPGGSVGRKRRFVAVLVDLPTAQPIPVPVNPPTSVQAVLGSHVAKVSWHQPHLLGGQGENFREDYLPVNLKNIYVITLCLQERERGKIGHLWWTFAKTAIVAETRMSLVRFAGAGARCEVCVQVRGMW